LFSHQVSRRNNAVFILTDFHYGWQPFPFETFPVSGYDAHDV
jgi:hypothetical protein